MKLFALTLDQKRKGLAYLISAFTAALPISRRHFHFQFSSKRQHIETPHRRRALLLH